MRRQLLFWPATTFIIQCLPFVANNRVHTAAHVPVYAELSEFVNEFVLLNKKIRSHFR